MTSASLMAEPTPIVPSDPGAPIARDAIDPDLVKLARTRTRVGVVTALGLVILCAVFLHRLAPDRRFGSSSMTPTPAQLSAVLAGEVASDQLIAIDAEPLTAYAIRTTRIQTSLGFRLAPARGSHERLWLVVSGDGDEPPATPRYVGRLRKLDDLPIAEATRAFARTHPRPVFATAAAVRAGLAGGPVVPVGGDPVTVAEGDAVELDLVEPEAATIAASFHDRLPDLAAWQAALARAGVTVTSTGTPNAGLGQIRFSVRGSVADTTRKLEAARLFDARIEPVTRHAQTTWGALRASPPTALAIGGAPVPDAQIDLIGLYVLRDIPDGAYAVVTGEVPTEYWYVMPITVALAAILLVFAWALIRAVRRDLLPTRA
jgi:hypothetical protein